MSFFFDNKYIFVIDFKFPKEYPFRPPSVKITNDKNYIMFLTFMPK